MKKGLILGISFLSLTLLTACSSDTNSNKANNQQKTEETKKNSAPTAKDAVENSANDLKAALNATPKADMDQELDPTIIPNYIGMTLDQANTIKDSLKDATFIQSLGDTVYRKDLPEDTILAQSEEPGTQGNGQWVTFITSTQNESMATPMDEASF